MPIHPIVLSSTPAPSRHHRTVWCGGSHLSGESKQRTTLSVPACLVTRVEVRRERIGKFVVRPNRSMTCIAILKKCWETLPWPLVGFRGVDYGYGRTTKLHPHPAIAAEIAVLGTPVSEGARSIQRRHSPILLFSISTVLS